MTVSPWVWFALYWVFFLINTSVLQYLVMGFGLLLLLYWGLIFFANDMTVV